jgi:exopolyphosphatase/guanosine-5'-triphosphate,3'-diphosphate pyrophosphatase
MLENELFKNNKSTKLFKSYFMKRVAAIDIGSNAIRLTIAEVLSPLHFNVIEKFRFPIKLGSDVFQTGEIGLIKTQELIEVFRNIKTYLDQYEVQDIRAVATSAMRDASNSKTIISKILEISKIKITVISGIEEANLIFQIIAHELPILTGKVLLIDIGGGSTEISFINEGILEKVESFNVGTIRLLNDQKNELKNLIESVRSQISNQKYKVVGTGGNLRRMGKLRKKIFNKNDVTIIHKIEVLEMYNHLKNFTPLQLMKKYDLKHDRAEVITPALLIISSILNEINVDIVDLPKVGLSDSLLLEMSSSSNFTLPL